MKLFLTLGSGLASDVAHNLFHSTNLMNGGKKTEFKVLKHLTDWNLKFLGRTTCSQFFYAIKTEFVYF